jgi:hypothetical protein
MNRFWAFAIHLGISLVIFAILAYLVVFVWYPGFFFATDGGWEGIRIIVFVDLILGPTLTLIVFRRGKPGLATDLTLIGVFQLACLSAGSYVVYSERPIALVYSDDRFSSMSSEAYSSVGADIPALDKYSGDGPKWITLELPDDLHAQSDIRGAALRAGKPLHTFAEYYVAFDSSAVNVDGAFAVDELRDRDRETQQIPVWLEQHGGELSDYAFFPMSTRYAYVFLGFHKTEQTFLGILNTPAPL